MPLKTSQNKSEYTWKENSCPAFLGYFRSPTIASASSEGCKSPLSGGADGPQDAFGKFLLRLPGCCTADIRRETRFGVGSFQTSARCSIGRCSIGRCLIGRWSIGRCSMIDWSMIGPESDDPDSIKAQFVLCSSLVKWTVDSVSLLKVFWKQIYKNKTSWFFWDNLN